MDETSLTLHTVIKNLNIDVDEDMRTELNKIRVSYHYRMLNKVDRVRLEYYIEELYINEIMGATQ